MVFNQSQNPQIKNTIIDNLRLNPVVDNIPNVVTPSIQPVFETDRKFCDVVRTNSITATSGSSTLFTTPSDKDFYITGAAISMAKDATCDLATSNVNITIIVGGTSRQIVQLSALTTTAQTQNMFVNFNPPIKVDRNTAISRGSFSFTAGSGMCQSAIWGYTQDTAIKTV